ncbi:MAG: hypothetical protein RLZZ338_1490 [Cyanobacteriota bacterium]|jgi:hypothetical protein
MRNKLKRLELSFYESRLKGLNISSPLQRTLAIRQGLKSPGGFQLKLTPMCDILQQYKGLDRGLGRFFSLEYRLKLLAKELLQSFNHLTGYDSVI